MGRADLLFFTGLSVDIDEIDLSRSSVYDSQKTSGQVFHLTRLIENRRLLSSLSVRLQASTGLSRSRLSVKTQAGFVLC